MADTHVPAVCTICGAAFMRPKVGRERLTCSRRCALDRKNLIRRERRARGVQSSALSRTPGMETRRTAKRRAVTISAWRCEGCGCKWVTTWGEKVSQWRHCPACVRTRELEEATRQGRALLRAYQYSFVCAECGAAVGGESLHHRSLHRNYCGEVCERKGTRRQHFQRLKSERPEMYDRKLARARGHQMSRQDMERGIITEGQHTDPKVRAVYNAIGRYGRDINNQKRKASANDTTTMEDS